MSALDGIALDVLRRLSERRWSVEVSLRGPGLAVTLYDERTHDGHRDAGTDLARTALRAMRRAGLDADAGTGALYCELARALDADEAARAPTIPAPPGDGRAVRHG